MHWIQQSFHKEWGLVPQEPLALAQGSTVVTLVSTTCSETLEMEHRLCRDKDLWLAEERGLGAFREPQGPRPGRQQEKAALNCSRNLP